MPRARTRATTLMQEWGCAFKARKLQFMGQAGVALATAGANSTPTYNEGVAVFTLTTVGLMGELTVSGAKFTYKDLE